MTLTVVQILPSLETGGVERGTLEIGGGLVRRGHRSIVISGGGRMVAELTGAGSEHIALPVGKKSLSSLTLIPRLREILEEKHVDILHVRSRMPAWIAYLAWRGMDIRIRPGFITSVHGPYSVNPYSRIMTRGQRIIAISLFIRDYILSNFPRTDPARIVTIPRGIDPDRFPYGFRPDAAWMGAWRQELPRLEDRRILTLPARLTRWKGQTDFLRIISELKKSVPNIHGLIVGAAHLSRRGYLAELKALARGLDIDENISFLGHRDDLREIMCVSDLVLSLATEPEAFGRATLEALAMGVPVVACDHGGAGEVLRVLFPEGLFAPGDIAGGIALIRRFLVDCPRVAQHNPFLLDQMIRDTIAVYEELGVNTRAAPGAP